MKHQEKKNRIPLDTLGYYPYKTKKYIYKGI